MILENIQRLCKEKGTSIASLERTLGMGNGTISKWANATPKVTNLKAVAEFFSVTVDELLKEDT